MLKVGPLGIIMETLLSIPGIFADSFLVTNVAMEITSRYAAYFENHEAQCEFVVGVFLSDRGIFSANPSVAAKAALEFFRLSEKLKNQPCLTKHYRNVLERLKLCIRETLLGHTRLSQDDLQSLYQCVGTILAHKSIPITFRIATIQELALAEKELLAASGQSQKTMERVVKNIAHILRGFEAEVAPELKLILAELSQYTISVFQSCPANASVRDSVVLLFNRMIVAVGKELLPTLKQLMAVILQGSDPTALLAIMKLGNLAVITWKEQGVTLAGEMLAFLLNSVLAIGYPASKVSDIERAQVDVVHAFIKLLKSITIINQSALFNIPIENYTGLMTYLAKWTYSTLDETLRKVVITLIVMMVSGGAGTEVTCEVTTQLLERMQKSPAKAPLADPALAAHAAVLIQAAEICASRPLDVLSPFNAVDMQALGDVAVLHAFLHRLEGDRLAAAVCAWGVAFGLNNPKAVKDALESAVKTGQAKGYKELLRKALLAVQKSRTNSGTRT